MLRVHGLNAIFLIECRGKWRFFLQLLQYCYITVLWIYGLRGMLLVQGRGEMAVLPAVTAVLLHHSAMDIWTEGNVVSTG